VRSEVRRRRNHAMRMSARALHIYIERERGEEEEDYAMRMSSRERARERGVRRRKHVCGANPLFSLMLHII
jgi:hypothetical protein